MAKLGEQTAKGFVQHADGALKQTIEALTLQQGEVSNWEEQAAQAAATVQHTDRTIQTSEGRAQAARQERDVANGQVSGWRAQLASCQQTATNSSDCDNERSRIAY